MIVIVDLRGFHPFVTEENVYNLAKLIYDKLPEEFPIAEQINTTLSGIAARIDRISISTRWK